MSKSQCRLGLSHTLWALIFVVACARPGEAVTVNGTEYPVGTAIDNEFSAVGVLFNSQLGYVTFADDDFLGIFGTAPGSSWAGIIGASFSAPIEATFVAPGGPLVPGIVNGEISARFGDGGGDLDSLRLRAFDVNDLLIGSAFSQATDFGMISFTGTGIHRVVIDQDPAGPATTNTALDFLTFPTPFAVPEPTGAVLITLSVAASAFRRVRRPEAWNIVDARPKN